MIDVASQLETKQRNTLNYFHFWKFIWNKYFSVQWWFSWKINCCNFPSFWRFHFLWIMLLLKWPIQFFLCSHGATRILVCGLLPFSRCVPHHRRKARHLWSGSEGRAALHSSIEFHVLNRQYSLKETRNRDQCRTKRTIYASIICHDRSSPILHAELSLKPYLWWSCMARSNFVGSEFSRYIDVLEHFVHQRRC